MAVLIVAGNDYGFDEIFERQVAAFGAPGDVLVCLTTSRQIEKCRARAGRSESAPTENDRPPWLRRRINYRNGGLSIF